jgi:hypothetical protein
MWPHSLVEVMTINLLASGSKLTEFSKKLSTDNNGEGTNSYLPGTVAASEVEESVR